MSSRENKTNPQPVNFWKAFMGSGMVTFLNALRVFVVNKLLAVFLPPSAFAVCAVYWSTFSLLSFTNI